MGLMGKVRVYQTDQGVVATNDKNIVLETDGVFMLADGASKKPCEELYAPGHKVLYSITDINLTKDENEKYMTILSVRMISLDEYRKISDDYRKLMDTQNAKVHEITRKTDETIEKANSEKKKEITALGPFPSLESLLGKIFLQ